MWDGGGGPTLSPREQRMKEIEEELEPVCGKCKYFSNDKVCPRARNDWQRLVRIRPLYNAEPCEKWMANIEYEELDQEYVYLKLQENL